MGRERERLGKVGSWDVYVDFGPHKAPADLTISPWTFLAGRKKENEKYTKSAAPRDAFDFNLYGKKKKETVRFKFSFRLRNI